MQNLVLDIIGEIWESEQRKTYKNIGIEEGKVIQGQQMKKRLKKEYIMRLRILLKLKLNAKDKITAIGALAIPVLTQSFGIIN